MTKQKRKLIVATLYQGENPNYDPKYPRVNLLSVEPTLLALDPGDYVWIVVQLGNVAVEGATAETTFKFDKSPFVKDKKVQKEISVNSYIGEVKKLGNIRTTGGANLVDYSYTISVKYGPHTYEIDPKIRVNPGTGSETT